MKFLKLLFLTGTFFLTLSQASAEKALEPLVLDMNAAHLSRYDAADDNSLSQAFREAYLVGLDVTLGEYIVAALEATRSMPDTLKDQRVARLQAELMAIQLKSGEKLAKLFPAEMIFQRNVTERVYRHDADGSLVEADPTLHISRCTSRGCTPIPNACQDASDWTPHVTHSLDTMIFFGIIDVKGFGYAFEACNEDIELRTRRRYVRNMDLKVGPDISTFRNDGVCDYDNNDFDRKFLSIGSTIQARFTAINFDTHSILSGRGLSDLAFDGYQNHICED